MAANGRSVSIADDGGAAVLPATRPLSKGCCALRETTNYWARTAHVGAVGVTSNVGNPHVSMRRTNSPSPLQATAMIFMASFR